MEAGAAGGSPTGLGEVDIAAPVAFVASCALVISMIQGCVMHGRMDSGRSADRLQTHTTAAAKHTRTALMCSDTMHSIRWGETVHRHMVCSLHIESIIVAVVVSLSMSERHSEAASAAKGHPALTPHPPPNSHHNACTDSYRGSPQARSGRTEPSSAAAEVATRSQAQNAPHHKDDRTRTHLGLHQHQSKSSLNKL